MYYAVTNHLFPKDEWVDRFVTGFANSQGRPITEFWSSPRFEMRRPLEGNEWLSTSIWQNADSFDAWRSSDDIKRAHSRTTADPFTRRALLSFHDIVMNAAPGRKAEIGVTEPYPLLGDAFTVLRRCYPKEAHADDVIKAFAALEPGDTPGWLWWDLWKVVKGEDWWNISYFESREAAEAARSAGFPYLSEPGNPDWYEKPTVETLYEVELERIPGMEATRRRERVGAGV